MTLAMNVQVGDTVHVFGVDHVVADVDVDHAFTRLDVRRGLIRDHLHFSNTHRVMVVG